MRNSKKNGLDSKQRSEAEFQEGPLFLEQNLKEKNPQTQLQGNIDFTENAITIEWR
jgi:hypothetical protein